MLNQSVTREDVFRYAKEHYRNTPEYLWLSLPNYAVLRRDDNKKWYALLMDIPRDKLGIPGEGRIDVLDLKCHPDMREILLGQKGFLPAYHLNRQNWISVLLDGSVGRDALFELLETSYQIAKGKSKKSFRTEITSWLVPANPKYYDIEKAFAESDTILWKQTNCMIVGDIIYLYMAAPYSAVIYKCRAVEVDIPYEYDDGKVHMKKVMRIQRLYTYDKTAFGLDQLKEHGVYSVRGPRSVPYGLRCKLERVSENDSSQT